MGRYANPGESTLLQLMHRHTEQHHRCYSHSEVYTKPSPRCIHHALSAWLHSYHACSRYHPLVHPGVRHASSFIAYHIAGKTGYAALCSTDPLLEATTASRIATARMPVATRSVSSPFSAVKKHICTGRCQSRALERVWRCGVHRTPFVHHLLSPFCAPIIVAAGFTHPHSLSSPALSLSLTCSLYLSSSAFSCSYA